MCMWGFDGARINDGRITARNVFAYRVWCLRN